MTALVHSGLPMHLPREGGRARGTPHVLDHPMRAEIYSILRDRPGVGCQEIARSLGTSHVLATYHLRRLEAAGIVTGRRLRRRVRYAIAGTRFDLTRAEHTATPLAALVAAAVEKLHAEGEATLKAIARDTGRAPSLCHYHLSRLQAAGLLRARGEGRARVYLPSGEAAP